MDWCECCSFWLAKIGLFTAHCSQRRWNLEDSPYLAIPSCASNGVITAASCSPTAFPTVANGFCNPLAAQTRDLLLEAQAWLGQRRGQRGRSSPQQAQAAPTFHQSGRAEAR